MKFVIFSIAAISLTSVAGLNISKTELLPEGRISRGRIAIEGQFPYMVGLILKSHPESQPVLKWGGSLIRNDWILTAAHCTEDIEQMNVLLRSTEDIEQVNVLLRATDIRYPEIIHSVTSENIIVHTGYNSVTVKNDIALIKIPFTSYTMKIMPVRLPSLASTYSTYSGVIAVMAGWGGTTDYNSGEINHLRLGKFYTIENSLCAMTYGDLINASNICIATGAGIDTCNGDSGGPLVALSTNRLIGIDSFALSLGCQKGRPIAFTRITSYLDWIQKHTGIIFLTLTKCLLLIFLSVIFLLLPRV